MEIKSNSSKKAQVTLFVIIAVIIIGILIAGYMFRDRLFFSSTDSQFQEVYDYYDSCIYSTAQEGIKIMGSSGGYIDLPEFEGGSEYAPFSSQLDFLGSGVPYWYYVSGNGIVNEQVPSQSLMQNQLGDYIESELKRCDFSSFRLEGYEIDNNVNSVEVSISKNVVGVNVNSDLSVSRVGSSEIKKEHNVNVNSKLGKFYDLAIEIYNKELDTAFLENYTIDVMYNYAPVTDIEISCSPVIWNAREVADDIKSGIYANINSLKLEGDYYSLSKKENNYFVVPIDSDEQVSFMYDPRWPSRIEIWPAENDLLVAEPVGLEEGMGILGFCYVPYHFVYDIYHPVLVQIYDEDELFQFPMAVVIDKGVPRNAIESSLQDTGEIPLCDYKTNPVEVYTFDSELNPVEADIDFQCFNEVCDIGRTISGGGDAYLDGMFPACVNGIIKAKAEGYVSSKYVISTNEEEVANIVLDKLYDLDLEVVSGGLDVKDRSGMALISFSGERHSASAFYPEQGTIRLAEGFYNVSVQVFGDSNLVIPSEEITSCVDVVKPGIFGFFGGTQEQCFTTTLPSQNLGSALVGGGKSQEYILESDLSFGRLKLSVNQFPPVNSLDQVQANYDMLDIQNIGVSFE